MYYREWIILAFNAIFDYTFNLNVFPSEILSGSLHYTKKSLHSSESCPFLFKLQIISYQPSWSHTFVLTTQVTSQPQREEFKGSHL